ncbi:MAG TPA: hypothetical protein PK771_07880, partial [Spirochaetota bacterium]|nr:hypothetical protein [Spirochaetota bacterium]
FPEYPPIEVKDSYYFFDNDSDDAKCWQIVAFDLSADKIVNTYDLGYNKTWISNFIYVKHRKKCFFTFWGDENILLEFDPATGKSRRIGNQSYINADTVFLNPNIDNESLILQDNHGEALYRYFYDRDEVVKQEYKFILDGEFMLNNEKYITYTDTFDNIGRNQFIYNWTGQKDTGIDLNKEMNIVNDPNPYNNFQYDYYLYIYKSEFLGVGYKDEYTKLYKIESYVPFKVSDVVDVIKDNQCYGSFMYNNNLYFFSSYLGWYYYRDIIKYDPVNYKVLDRYGTNDRNKTYNFDHKQHVISGKYLYSIAVAVKDRVLKIDLDDFSVKVIER